MGLNQLEAEYFRLIGLRKWLLVTFYLTTLYNSAPASYVYRLLKSGPWKNVSIIPALADVTNGSKKEGKYSYEQVTLPKTGDICCIRLHLNHIINKPYN